VASDSKGKGRLRRFFSKSQTSLDESQEEQQERPSWPPVSPSASNSPAWIRPDPEIQAQRQRNQEQGQKVHELLKLIHDLNVHATRIFGKGANVAQNPKDQRLYIKYNGQVVARIEQTVDLLVHWRIRAYTDLRTGQYCDIDPARRERLVTSQPPRQEQQDEGEETEKPAKSSPVKPRIELPQIETVTETADPPSTIEIFSPQTQFSMNETAQEAAEQVIARLNLAEEQARQTNLPRQSGFDIHNPFARPPPEKPQQPSVYSLRGSPIPPDDQPSEGRRSPSPLPPIPPTRHAHYNSNNEPKVTYQQPAFFDGTNKNQWRLFSKTLNNYLDVHEAFLNTEKKQIHFAGSLLRNDKGFECPSANFFDKWVNDHSRYGTQRLRNDIGFDEFFEDLRKEFEPRDSEEKAIKELTEMRQGKLPLIDFFQKFELLASRANITSQHQILIAYLRVAIKKEYIDDLFRTPLAVPRTFPKFKEALLQLEENYNFIKTSTPTFTRPQWNPPAGQHSGGVPAKSYTAPAGSAGAPMDIGATNMCFNCGKVPRTKEEFHRADECKEPCYRCNKKHPNERHKDGKLVPVQRRPRPTTTTPAKKLIFNRANVMEAFDFSQATEAQIKDLEKLMDF
jgi:hypothetical protein